jgi:DNA mismatch repair ATPase MutS
VNFKTDKQTTDDLGIFDKIRENSVYGIFNKTVTHGGASILEEMFTYPLADEDKINERGQIIRFFKNSNIEFPFRGELFDTALFYLGNTDSRTRLSAYENNLERKFRNAIGSDTEYRQLAKGVLAILEILNTLRDFLRKLEIKGIDASYKPSADTMLALLSIKELEPCFNEREYKKLPYAKIAGYDQNFRFNLREKLLSLLRQIYFIDVFVSVAKTASERNFVYASALPPGSNELEIEGLYHPLLKNPVSNAIKADRSSNMIFLTGANMAGKSTFMKSFGIALYLAHMGFPVPAASMKFSVMHGMFTTINLPDNINMGYSHFYAEVMRVKKVAESLGKNNNLIVIFDELFRGTNVKDAYDATVAVSEAFASNNNCIFVISTHIIEAGETLGERCKNISFINLPTVMEGSVPRYTYKVAPGITSDRHGMIIIRNEGILDILKGAKQSKV